MEDTADSSASTTINDSSTSHLLSLPCELLSHILTFLDWPALKHVRNCNVRLHSLLSLAKLETHRVRCKQELLVSEHCVAAEIAAAFWEDVELSHEGYYSSSYHSSSMDPDIRAHSQGKECSSSSLPCYRCLQWLPCYTDKRFRTESAFSRRMCTLSRDIGGKDAIRRICVDCGIRTKVYPKGCSVKHSIVCIRCGELSEPSKTDGENVWVGSSRSTRLHCERCRGCEQIPEKRLRVLLHESRYRWVEIKMRKRLIASIKARQLAIEDGRAQGLVVKKTEWKQRGEWQPGIRWCPVVEEWRFCQCGINVVRPRQKLHYAEMELPELEYRVLTGTCEDIERFEMEGRTNWAGSLPVNKQKWEWSENRGGI